MDLDSIAIAVISGLFILLWHEMQGSFLTILKFFYLVILTLTKSLFLAAGNGLFQKKSKQVGLKKYFFKISLGISHFFTLFLEIPDKTKLNIWIFHKIVLDPLENPRPKTKTPGNSTPWKFHFV